MRLAKPVMSADIYGHLMILAARLDDKPAALRYAERAAASSGKAFGKNSDNAILVMRELGVLYAQLHDFKAAQSWLQKGLALQKDCA